ncbi:hypothetical protein ACIRL2_46790 [Embleya sp. NPDC127516]|uniref:hypothetical protein n=1 Tax=Embleya sp. NPDC127516 TaxID=3363990 RepID=UPI00382CDEF0
MEPGGITDALTGCAHLFQARVDKVADIRATVVGERVFCARITAPRGVLDWRAAYKSLTYTVVMCPRELHVGMRRFLADFGLSYGAFDFAVTADGTWRFLECNPNGQWGWVQHETGLKISSALADLLENGETRT